MANEKTKTGTAERTKINVNESEDLLYWTDKFGVTAVRIKDAVAAVGPSATKVEQSLKK